MSDATSYGEGPKEFNFVTRFLIFCAGADKRLLAQCPNSDIVKIQGIGGVVAATGILAFLSGSYAIYTVFSPKESLIGGAAALATPPSGGAWAATWAGALLFGLIWSLVIFNLDRFIVAASGPGDGKDSISWSEFRSAFPRLLLAILIGIVLSAPLEIRIMKTEIEAELSKAQQKMRDSLNAQTRIENQAERARLEAELARVNGDIANLQTKLTEIEQQRNTFTERLNQEIGAGGGGRGKGDGPVAASLREELRLVEARLALERAAVQPQIEGLQRERVELQGQIGSLNVTEAAKFELNSKNAQRDDGLMRRIELAHEVSPVASYLLMALLIVIEVAPIFFKLMLIAGPYEYFTENEKRLAIARRAIDVGGSLIPGADGKQGGMLEVKGARYAQAEAIAEREVGKWRVEAHLTEVALAAHRRRLETDIGANPERYVEQPSTPDKA